MFPGESRPTQLHLRPSWLLDIPRLYSPTQGIPRLLHPWVGIDVSSTVASQPGDQNSPFYLKYDTVHTGTPGWSLHFTQTDTTGPTNKIAYVSGATAGTWTHLVGTFDATTDTGRLYVNGSLAATVTGVTPWASTGPFTVGSAKYNGAVSDYFPGTVSDVQAWNYNLDADQVTALYDQIP
ncbi:hypothetical protein GO605_08160 [Streptomyces murinus]|nr:hypothetical protein GO605_08160 [Streptomyces murinus]